MKTAAGSFYNMLLLLSDDALSEDSGHMSSEEVEVHDPTPQPVMIPTAQFGADLPESNPPSLPSVPLSRMNKSQKSVEESLPSGKGKNLSLCSLFQVGNFIFERGRPFSFCKGHFYRKILKSMGIFWRGTKDKTKGNRGHCLLLAVVQCLSVCVFVGKCKLLYKTTILI